MGFLFETFPVANQPRHESDGSSGGARMVPFKARRSAALAYALRASRAADVRLAPFIRQPALAYGLLGVLRPMPAYAVRRIDTCNTIGLRLSLLFCVVDAAWQGVGRNKSPFLFAKGRRSI